ncbi:hypothetical protein DAA51_20815 [Bradyrhizobium sp. WBAH10]|nr:hypothetical protein [Bradyrhizobium sp. WBAH30]MDD1541338.1 hypothetical protein [Bradyrhizobium sp. WBAH41]MDD1589608.1 hypothetical protein [Bradyrhizobium sp. WBAH42]NRB90555.1 hypothetical protein [Bradyrhizobium sp. WBAH10]QCJ83357.1 hypothetical protein DAA53_21000 [Bradyrhizobium sp. WBAH23]QCJ90722.1 hypothetical protein DAA57_21070 [Bradyrhizobium yuanmingense]
MAFSDLRPFIPEPSARNLPLLIVAGQGLGLMMSCEFQASQNAMRRVGPPAACGAQIIEIAPGVRR